jgi:UDP-N-acetylglucosamine:LPS N-acetylglucosamine transferase
MKVLAVASKGGHWVELLRVLPAFSGMEMVYVSTDPHLAGTVEGSKFYCVPDANRWNKFKLVKIFMMLFKIVFNERPKFVISTGAAPGLMALMAGKMLGIKTIWIDTIASAEKLSLSGRIALKFVDRLYTQWPDLSGPKIIYAGNILL